MKSGLPAIVGTTLFLVFSLSSLEVQADKVYQWTDEDGVVQFSDVPPAGTDSAGVNEINLVNFSNSNRNSDQYSIMNQLETMTQWRREAEQAQQDRLQTQIETTPTQPQYESSNDMQALETVPVIYNRGYNYPNYRYHRRNSRWVYPDNLTQRHQNPPSQPGLQLKPGEIFYRLK